MSAARIFVIFWEAKSIIVTGVKMASEKDIPPGVPEENEYHRLHWAVLLTYAVACVAIYMLLFLE